MRFYLFTVYWKPTDRMSNKFPSKYHWQGLDMEDARETFWQKYNKDAMKVYNIDPRKTKGGTQLMDNNQLIIEVAKLCPAINKAWKPEVGDLTANLRPGHEVRIWRLTNTVKLEHNIFLPDVEQCIEMMASPENRHGHYVYYGHIYKYTETCHHSILVKNYTVPTVGEPKIENFYHSSMNIACLIACEKVLGGEDISKKVKELEG